jgi:hypothetical protein
MAVSGVIAVSTRGELLWGLVSTCGGGTGSILSVSELLVLLLLSERLSADLGGSRGFRNKGLPGARIFFSGGALPLKKSCSWLDRYPVSGVSAIGWVNEEPEDTVLDGW